jgi:hypothetical protein
VKYFFEGTEAQSFRFLALRSMTTDPNFDFMNILNNFEANDDNYISNDSPYDNTIISCSYLDELQFSTSYKNSEKFSLVSFNTQSLSAKFLEFNELIIMLQTDRCVPDVICLQEIWQFPDPLMFCLPGYNPLIYKTHRNNVRGGGVGIFV